MNSLNLKYSVRDLVNALRLYRIWVYQGYHSVAAKYKRSLLGPFWIAGSMLVTALSLSIVFGGIFGQPMREFLPYITSGLIIWAVVGLPLAEAPEIFVGSGHIIKNHAYPFSYYVLEMLSRNFIIFLHNIVVFFVVLLAVGSLNGIHWMLIPGIICTYLIVFFYATLSAMLGARFRDIRFIFPYIGQLLFFLTPIFWRAELVDEPRRILAHMNPLYHIVQLMRQPMMGLAPTLENWTISLSVLAGGMIIWLVFFSMHRRRIAFWV